MFKRLFAGALFAGLSAGALAALIYLTFVVPLIHEAELYETGALIYVGAPMAEGDMTAPAEPSPAVAPDPASDSPGTPAPGLFARNFATFGTLLVTYTGFALLLVAGFAIAERSGHVVTARRGAIWGLCGFIAFQLAPSFGLPPELPGARAAPLDLRQIWWIGCVLSTGAGLALLGFGRTVIALVAGAVLVAAPQVIGAPAAPYGGIAPPGLAAHFATRVLATAAVSWVLLGAIAGAFWYRPA